MSILASSCQVKCNSNDDNTRLTRSSLDLETNCACLSSPDRHLCAKKLIENLAIEAQIIEKKKKEKVSLSEPHC